MLSVHSVFIVDIKKKKLLCEVFVHILFVYLLVCLVGSWLVCCVFFLCVFFFCGVLFYCFVGRVVHFAFTPSAGCVCVCMCVCVCVCICKHRWILISKVNFLDLTSFL